MPVAPMQQAPAAPLIDVQGLSRSYGSVRALRHVTLRLEPGVVGLIGNNGAGKSTLLKLLLGLLEPDAGGGTILGCDIRSERARLRGLVGYLPETAAVVPGLKGSEFVSLAGDLYGMPRRDARRRAHEVLNYVGLGELRYRRLEEYSTGNLQRLKLAAALVHDPALLLLDEPTNGLDPDGRRAMLELISDLIRETNKSVILCTHLLDDVERLCRQLVVLHQGEVVCAGDISTLLTQANHVYHVTWRQADGDWPGALAAAGVKVGSLVTADVGDSRHMARLGLPDDWPTWRLFESAHRCGATIEQLQPERDDLERLFFRLTQLRQDAPRETAAL